MQLVGAGQELQPGKLSHLVVNDQQRDALTVLGQPAQLRERRGRGRLAQHPEVQAESSAEVLAEREHDAGVVVEDEKDWACHLLPLSRSRGGQHVLLLVHLRADVGGCGRHEGSPPGECSDGQGDHDARCSGVRRTFWTVRQLMRRATMAP